jgi:hypothetical protein
LTLKADTTLAAVVRALTNRWSLLTLVPLMPSECNSATTSETVADAGPKREAN